MSIDVKALMEDAKKEIARRKACPRHNFPAKDGYALGERLICQDCGCTMRLTEIALYARGYKAAGGNPDDILFGIVGTTSGGAKR